MRCQAEPVILKTEELATNGDKLRTLAVQTADSLSQRQSEITAWAMYRDQLYPLRFEKGRLVMKSAGALELSAALATSEMAQNPWNMPRGFRRNDEDASDEAVFRKFQLPLIGRSLDVNTRQTLSDFVLPQGVVRIFVYAPLPESLATRLTTSRDPSRQLSRASGRVLYVVDVHPTDAGS